MADILLPKLPDLSLENVINFSSPTYWSCSDPERFGELMKEAISLVGPAYFLGDNLFTWGRNNSAFEDTPFRTAWQENIKNNADETIVWRRYILSVAAYHCINLPGDFAEFGVFLGSGIKTVMDYLGGINFPKVFWGYDTFDYNPVPGHDFVEHNGLFNNVTECFREYPQVKLIKGLLPDSFLQGAPESLAYMHIDLNNFEAEISVLNTMFEKVVSGGIIILDDYEWSDYRLQKKEEDQWFDKRNYRVFPLPTGQGLVIKR